MKIYEFLQKSGPASVSDIVDHLDLKQPTISYHLKEMQDNGLLDCKKKGKSVFYFINEGCTHDHLACHLCHVAGNERKA